MEEHEFLITDDIFTNLRTDFNIILKRALFTMLSKGNDSGEINLKLKISLNHDILDNLKFEHKITSSIYIRDETSKNIYGKYEMLSDGKYYLSFF